MKNKMKRMTALLLSIVMLLSSVVLTAAEEPDDSITAETLGQELVNRYGKDMTEQEIALLTSGILAQPNLEPKIDTVSVDYQDKTVTAAPYEDNGFCWEPVSVTVDGKQVSLGDDGTAKIEIPFHTLTVQYRLTVTTEKQDQYLQVLKHLMEMLSSVQKAADGAEVLQWLLDQEVLVDLSDASKNLIAGFYLNMQGDSSYANALQNPVSLKELWENYYAGEVCSYSAYGSGEGTYQVGSIIKNNEIESIVPENKLKVQPEDAASLAKELVNAAKANKLAVYNSHFGNGAYQNVAGMVDATFGKSMQNLFRQAVVAYDINAAFSSATTFDIIYYQLTQKIGALSPADQTGLLNKVGADKADAQTIYKSIIRTISPAANYDWTCLAPLADGADAASLDKIVNDVTAPENLGQASSTIPLYRTAEVTVNSAEYNVTKWDGTTETLPYGSEWELPCHKDPAMIWVYTVNGIEYEQGTSLQVTEDLTVTREAWENHSWGSLLATLYDDNDAAKAILGSPALKTGYMKLHTPKDESLATVAWSKDAQYTVTAQTFAANGSLNWQPTAVAAKNGGVIKETVSIINNTATVSTGAYDTMDVTYQVTLNYPEEIDTATILALPQTLAEKTTDQLGVMADMSGNGMVTNLEKVQGLFSSLYSIVYAEGEGDTRSIAALNEVRDKCTYKGTYTKHDASGNEEMKDGKPYIKEGDIFHLYDHIIAYRKLETEAQRLAYYYAHSEEILPQLEILKDNLLIITKDSHIEKILDLFGESDRLSQIDELIEEFNDACENMQNAAPSTYIDPKAEEGALEALAAAVLEYHPAEGAKIPEEGNALLLTAVVEKTDFDEKAACLITVTGGEQSPAPLSGGGMYDLGEDVTVSATDAEGFEFIGWYDDSGCVSGENDYTFTPTSDTNLTAKYRPIQTEFTITLFDANGEKSTVKKTAGEQYTAECDDGSFRYWVNENGKIVSREKKYTFIVIRDRELTPICSGGGAQVMFLSAYGQVMSSCMYTAGTSIAVPPAPANMGYTFAGWALNGVTYTEDTDLQGAVAEAAKDSSWIELVAQYTESEDEYTITVTYSGVEKSNDTYTQPCGTAVRLSAEQTIDGMPFSHWMLGDEIVSYNTDYIVRTTKDVELTAVYDGEKEETPLITITDRFATLADTDTYRVSFSATRSIPESCTIIECGFLYGTDGSFFGMNKEKLLVLGGENVKKALANKTDRHNDVHTVNINTADPDTMFYVRGFVTYQDKNAEIKTVYSAIEKGSYSSLKGNN